MRTFMLRVGFEPTIPVLARAETFNALDSSATLIGFFMYLFIYFAYLFDEEQFLEKMNRSST
jgi:hypothetical protein